MTEYTVKIYWLIKTTKNVNGEKKSVTENPLILSIDNTCALHRAPQSQFNISEIEDYLAQIGEVIKEQVDSLQSKTATTIQGLTITSNNDTIHIVFDSHDKNIQKMFITKLKKTFEQDNTIHTQSIYKIKAKDADIIFQQVDELCDDINKLHRLKPKIKPKLISNSHNNSPLSTPKKTRSPVSQAMLFTADLLFLGGPLADWVAKRLTTQSKHVENTLKTNIKLTMRITWAMTLVATIATLITLYLLQSLPIPLLTDVATLSPILAPLLISVTIGLGAAYLFTYINERVKKKINSTSTRPNIDELTLTSQSSFNSTPYEEIVLMISPKTTRDIPNIQHDYKKHEKVKGLTYVYS